MSLKKFFILSFFVTVFALIYVQMQVSIYDLAYQGKVKEEQVSRLVDRNTHNTLNIARLTSARSLGGWFSEKNSEIDFINENNIVKVKVPAGDGKSISVASISTMSQNGLNALTRLFSLRSIAEAHPAR